MLMPKLHAASSIKKPETLKQNLILITVKFILGLQLGTIASGALCGAFAPRGMVELLQKFSSVFIACGTGSLAVGFLLVCTRQSWLGHSVFGTGGAALIAAWAGGWACCDPMQRVVDDATRPLLMPKSASANFEVVAMTAECDITTQYAEVGRRAVVVCCALSVGPYLLFAVCGMRVGNAVGLGGLFALIVCNEVDWDWRPIYSIAIAFFIALFFSGAVDHAAANKKASSLTFGERVALGWGGWLNLFW